MKYIADYKGPYVEILYENEENDRVKLRTLRVESAGRISAIQEILKIVNSHEPNNSIEITEEREEKIRKVMADRSLSFRDVIEAAFETGLEKFLDEGRFVRGDKVYYVPDHANGLNHKDVESGVVKSVKSSTLSDPQVPSYYVLYDSSNNFSKLTYGRNLQPRFNERQIDQELDFTEAS